MSIRKTVAQFAAENNVTVAQVYLYMRNGRIKKNIVDGHYEMDGLCMPEKFKTGPKVGAGMGETYHGE